MQSVPGPSEWGCRKSQSLAMCSCTSLTLFARRLAKYLRTARLGAQAGAQTPSGASRFKQSGPLSVLRNKILMVAHQAEELPRTVRDRGRSNYRKQPRSDKSRDPTCRYLPELYPLNPEPKTPDPYPKPIVCVLLWPGSRSNGFKV